MLADKAKDGKPIGNRKNKATSSGEQHAITLGPENVVIPKGVFSQQDGVHLQQLAVRQVSSKSAGIVVVSEAEVQPFLNTAQISEEGLAFLVFASECASPAACRYIGKIPSSMFCIR